MKAVAVLGAVAAGIGGVMWYNKMKLLSAYRGIRNNNPGNIERTSTQWDGMAEDQSGDERFIVFTDPRFGVRAMARILNTYRSRGVDTIAGIVSTWAPEFVNGVRENDTQSYIKSVSSKTGIGAGEAISQSDYPLVIAAIIQHENGIQPYSMALIQEGVSWA